MATMIAWYEKKKWKKAKWNEEEKTKLQTSEKKKRKKLREQQTKVEWWDRTSENAKSKEQK